MSTDVLIEIPCLTINVERVGENSLLGSFVAYMLKEKIDLSKLHILKIGKLQFIVGEVMDDVIVYDEITKVKNFIGSGISLSNIEIKSI